MKVISEIANRGVLVELSSTEFYNITGVRCEISQSYGYFNREVLGRTYNLNPVFAQVAGLPKALNEVTKAQIELRRIADLIEPVKAIVEDLTAKPQKNKP